MSIGRVSSFHAGGAVDGPGLRFVVFLQGCPLRCVYCHNPETWDESGGTNMSAEAVFEKTKRYIPYFGKDGGITVSGGEPLLQPEFVMELLRLCRRARIHTTLDTSGSIVGPLTAELLSLCDLVLLDVKFTDAERYQKYTSANFSVVQNFLGLLEQNHIDTWIRQVVVPGLNDSEGNIRRLQLLVKNTSCVKKIELLPFRKLCLEKYDQLGIPFPLAGTPELSADRLTRLSSLF